MLHTYHILLDKHAKKKQMGQRTQKQDGAQHAFFKKSRGVGSCALYQTDVRS